MNRKSILIWAMAIGTLSSCMSNEDMYDPEKAEAMKVAKYEAAFVKKYGKVDPKQDWGFGEAEAAMQAVTRGGETGYNITTYVSYDDFPVEITPEEQSKDGEVVRAFRDNDGGILVEDVSWTDFFVQHVYAGKHGYSNNKGNSISDASSHMDQLKCGNMDVNSFNAGNGHQKDNFDIIIGKDHNNQDIRKNVSSSCVLMQNVETKFSYHNSYDNEQQWHSEYIIKKIGESYYVGFDFVSVKDNLGGDGKYDDWIIKITPAKYKNARRIMAEDLVVDSKSDFDFNDVVFDAAIVNGDAVITLQAVGGVLPLHIGKLDDKYEVHKLFGVEQNVFVNTRNRGEKAPVMFRLTGYNWNSSLDDIAIYVEGDEIKKQKDVRKTAPAKLCCPTKYMWASETTSIEKHFPNFETAVGNAEETWYEGGAE